MNMEEQRTSCPGFLDEYGIWNNGFDCPSISNQIRVCCSSDSRRYCCTLEHFYTNSPEKSLSSTNRTSLSFLKKINLTFLTLPMQLSFILILILIFLLILLILFLCYRYHKRKMNSLEQEHSSTKQILLSDHFPFSPPHHQLFFNENNPKIKDTLTTSTSSSSAIRLPSDIYLNDWKEIFQPNEQQSMNVYPTISSHNYPLHQQNDIIL
jgi:Ca2+/Na+ antiporter